MVDPPFESLLHTNEVAVAYFWSPTCRECKFWGPQIESLCKSRDIPLIKIDVSVDLDVALQYDVLSLPTVIFLRGGQAEKRLTSMSISMAEIESMMNTLTR